jgi:hypothetical protein
MSGHLSKSVGIKKTYLAKQFTYGDCTLCNSPPRIKRCSVNKHNVDEVDERAAKTQLVCICNI